MVPLFSYLINQKKIKDFQGILALIQVNYGRPFFIFILIKLRKVADLSIISLDSARPHYIHLLLL